MDSTTTTTATTTFTLSRRTSRRNMMAASAAALAGGAALLNGTIAAGAAEPAANQRPGPAPGRPRRAAAAPAPGGDDGAGANAAGESLPPGEPGRDYNPVVTPNNVSLPWRVVGGVKVYHLVAEEVDHEFAPGLKAKCWGYNGRVHGPTIEAVEGDRVRIYVTNRLAAPTTVHWHGIILPSGMDGVGGLNQPPIGPGETFRYEFVLRQHGTFMYHSHHDEMTQMAMGMMGLFVIHPRGVPPADRPGRDFAILLSEWAITPGTSRPNPNVMTDFNVLTMNARAFPGTEPLVARLGQRVRIRLGNLSAMDHHPIHLHGFEFPIVAVDGNDVPEQLRQKVATVLVPVGSTRDVEFVADNPGDWAMHCHMTHHVMNQMGHDVPNMIGLDAGNLDENVRRLVLGYMTMGQEGMGDMAEHMQHMGVPENSIPMVGAEGPFGYITMGGMFTILKVREDLPDGDGYADPGWYRNPPGTVAAAATAEELRRDGIDVGADALGGRRETENTAGTNAAGGYTCPHHPEVVSAEPGDCPKCGMTLRPNRK